MIVRVSLGLLCVVLVACGGGSNVTSSSSRLTTPQVSTPISLDWTQYHGNAGRSGAGPSEPAMTSPRVAWKSGVDGEVYASPLIIAGHVIVATENNTVYSLDVFTGSTIWQRHLGDPVDASSLPCGNIRPVTGITGTPAADIASGRVYAVAFLRGYHHVLFALSLTDGSVVWQQTVDPAGSDARVQQLRGGLAIGSGSVYVPFGGLFGDCGSYHGYVVRVPLGGGPGVAYRVSGATGVGVWSPQGPTIAPDGSVYVATGNATSGASAFAYSNSVLQLSPDLRSLRSYFAPSNWAALDAGDVDLGSTGVAVLPALARVFVIGKDGIGYLLQAGRLGGVGGQVASRRICSGAWGGTAWLGSMVYVPCIDGLYAVSVSESSLQVAWHAARPELAPAMTAAGAVWALEASSGTLYAFEPATGKTLFTARVNAANRYSTPAATEGFVVTPSGRSVTAVAVV